MVQSWTVRYVITLSTWMLYSTSNTAAMRLRESVEVVLKVIIVILLKSRYVLGTTPRNLKTNEGFITEVSSIVSLHPIRPQVQPRKHLQVVGCLTASIQQRGTFCQCLASGAEILFVLQLLENCQKRKLKSSSCNVCYSITPLLWEYDQSHQLRFNEHKTNKDALLFLMYLMGSQLFLCGNSYWIEK